MWGSQNQAGRLNHGQPQLCETPSNSATPADGRFSQTEWNIWRRAEEACRTKWEEFLADLEGNPDPATILPLKNAGKPPGVIASYRPVSLTSCVVKTMLLSASYAPARTKSS